MSNARLNAAVEELLGDRRLLKRFRRNPEKAMSRFDLTPAELTAVKTGDAGVLMSLGLDPKLVWPSEQPPYAMQSWLVLNARKLAPVALLAGLLAAWPSPAMARRTRRREGRGWARRFLRANPRARSAFLQTRTRRALRRALRNAGVRGAARRQLMQRSRSIVRRNRQIEN